MKELLENCVRIVPCVGSWTTHYLTQAALGKGIIPQGLRHAEQGDVSGLQQSSRAAPIIISRKGKAVSKRSLETWRVYTKMDAKMEERSESKVIVGVGRWLALEGGAYIWRWWHRGENETVEGLKLFMYDIGVHVLQALAGFQPRERGMMSTCLLSAQWFCLQGYIFG